jgi:hypothetical protein
MAASLLKIRHALVSSVAGVVRLPCGKKFCRLAATNLEHHCVLTFDVRVAFMAWQRRCCNFTTHWYPVLLVLCGCLHGKKFGRLTATNLQHH